MRGIVFAVLFIALALSAQMAPAHDTDATEILRELRELREDLDAILIPADVSGRWRITGRRCTGYVPFWIRQLLDVDSVGTFRIRQYGNHVVLEDGTGFLGATMRGDDMHAENDRVVATSSNDVVSRYDIINAAVLSRTRIRYTAHLHVGVNQDTYTRTCTGQWRRIGD